MNLLMKCVLIVLCSLGFACGDDGDESNSQPQSEDNAGNGCFTDAECAEGTFCEALDPTVSPEGSCATLGGEGASCVFGTQCADGLACAKERSAATGQCLPFPSDCPEPPTCDCAIALCASLAGSSCSVGSTERPESSITLSCAGGTDSE